VFNKDILDDASSVTVAATNAIEGGFNNPAITNPHVALQPLDATAVAQQTIARNTLARRISNVSHQRRVLIRILV
jgi:hypothetical protein